MPIHAVHIEGACRRRLRTGYRAPRESQQADGKWYKQNVYFGGPFAPEDTEDQHIPREGAEGAMATAVNQVNHCCAPGQPLSSSAARGSAKPYSTVRFGPRACRHCSAAAGYFLAATAKDFRKLLVR